MVDEEEIVLRARRLIDADELAEAESTLRKLTRQDTKLAKVYNNLAAICQRTRRPDEALWLMMIALELEPENAGFYFNSGVILSDLGRSSEAIHAYEKVLVLDPEHAAARLRLAKERAHRGELEQAESLLPISVRQGVFQRPSPPARRPWL